VPNPSTARQVNVGTARVRSAAGPRPGEWAADRRDACRRRGRDGAAVVLRARESREHGEGRQRVSQGGNSSRRFGDLFNLVYDPAFLVHAWERVSGNKGAR
jgi:hypothetical protein